MPQGAPSMQRAVRGRSKDGRRGSGRPGLWCQSVAAARRSGRRG
jgi:hypothetical protein